MALTRNLLGTLAMLGFASVACSSGSEPAPVGTPSVQFVAVPQSGDSVDARLPQPITIELTDNLGRRPAGVAVLVYGVQHITGIRAHVAEVRCGATEAVLADTAYVQTNSAGRVIVRCQNGPYTGPTFLFAEVTRLALRDSVSFTILAGAAASLRAIPRDTTLYVGSTFRPGAQAFDRHGNPRSDGAITATAGSRTSVDASGLATATAEGPGAVVMHLGSLVDTAHVAIPPVATFAAVTAPWWQGWIVVSNLDGTGMHRVMPLQQDESALLNWNPDGKEVWYSDSHGMGVNGAGIIRRLLPSSPLDRESTPVPAPDSSHIYFNGSVGTQTLLYRARLDGSDITLVGSDTDYVRGPISFSSEGSRFVKSCEGLRLCVVTLPTLESRSLDVTAARGRWSPRDELIAYTDWYTFQVMVVRADGTGVRALTPVNRYYSQGLDWTPNGQWIVVTASDNVGLELISPYTGETMTLHFGSRLISPVIRP